jgi:hypothetical protein
LWNAGRHEKAMAVVAAILSSPLDDEAEERSLAPFIEIGARLTKQVQGTMENLPTLSAPVVPSPPDELVTLQKMAKVIGDRHPAAKQWRALLNDWGDLTARALRKLSLERNAQDDNQGALNAVQEALKHAKSPQLISKLQEDFQTLEKILKDSKQESAFKDLTRISRAPSLYTVNGIGVTVYGSTPCPADPTLVYKVHYFVFAGIPIIPLGRYLVRETGQGQYQFFGKTPWTDGMKWHLGITVGLLCWAVIASATGSTRTDAVSDPAVSGNTSAGMVAPESAEPSSTYSDSTQSNIQDPAPQPVPLPSEPTANQKLQLEYDKLSVEIVDNDIKLEKTESDLSDRKNSLAMLKKRIENTDVDNYSQSSVDAYNSLVRKYESRRRSYNRDVDQYNRALTKQRARVKRHNQMRGN